jgi:hypothetical protein
VGGQSAANVAAAVSAANAATSTNTPNTIVTRDGSGNFSAGTISANLAGNATSATTTTNFTGNLADAQLSTNVPRLNGTNVFSGTNLFSGVVLATNASNLISGAFTGNGAGVTNLNATQLVSGTIPLAQLPPAVVTNGASGVAFSGTLSAGTIAATNFTGNGAGLTNLGAANLATGTVADVRLSTNVPLLNGTNGFTGTNRFAGVVQATNANNLISGAFTGNGAGVTNLNAANLAAGTLADVRLSANIPLLNGTNVFSGTNRFAGVMQATNSNNQFNGTYTGNGAGLTNLATVSTTNFALLNGTNVFTGTNSFSGNVIIGGEITSTAVNITSDRNAKEAFTPVNAREVLDKVSRLPITEWQYKTQAGARHLGPMAQDFHAAFDLGRDDRHITTVDEDGVALAAIQGLNEKLEAQARDKDQRIQQLENSVEALKTLVNQLAARQNGGAK